MILAKWAALLHLIDQHDQTAAILENLKDTLIDNVCIAH